MYDMTGFDYDITDVANLLRLHKRRGNYYDCPFCGDTKGRLNINPAKNVFRCNRCDKSGGMLQLYADLHNLTYREANEEIREALNKGEYRQVRQAKAQEEKEEPCSQSWRHWMNGTVPIRNYWIGFPFTVYIEKT